MDALLQPLFGILTGPPGNLIYHLALAFATFASLQAALIIRRGGTAPHLGRLLLGLNLLLIAQLLLFLGAGLAWQGVVNPHLFMPVFDRAVVVFGLIWTAWLWAFPRPARAADVVALLLSVGVVILFLFTSSAWSAQGRDLAFNGSQVDWAWSIAGGAVCVLGIAFLLILHPEGWGIGFGMLGLNLAGFVLHLLMGAAEGDYAGYLRVAQLAAFPLLPAVLAGYIHPDTRPPQVVIVKPSSPPRVEPVPEPARPRPLDPRAVHAWVDLNLQEEPQRIASGVARAVAYTLTADLCYLATAPQDARAPLVFQAGYDLVREEDLPGLSIETGRVPNLAAAIQKMRPQRFQPGESGQTDTLALAAALGLDQTGSVLVLPLAQSGAAWGALVLLCPYSGKVWQPEDQSVFGSEREALVQVLRRVQGDAERRLELEHLRSALEEIQAENRRLREDVQRWSTQAAPEPALPPDVEGLMAVQREAQETISALQSEIELLRAAQGGRPLAVSGKDDDVLALEENLRATLEELARLQNRLAESNMRVLELERSLGSGDHPPTEERDVIASIVQELRQPLSSIMGYTDLLLAESVGILGALQRKFLERIKASNERMRSLLDDLVQVTAMGSGPLELVHQAVDLSSVIDHAVSDVSAQLREKNIALRVDLPENLPPIYADRDALQQIIGQLLQNAGAVTPSDGSVALRASTREEDNGQFLIVQVTDTGGGIAADDLPRVFARRYRADHALIQGVGDKGVGLSIARTLVEAHGGRIWVESQAGRSSTFSVLLPTRPKSNGDTGQ